MVQTAQSHNASWREQPITLPAGVVTTITFPDTKPNYYQVNNLSANNLYFAASNIIPSISQYDMMIPSNGCDITGRGNGTTQVQIFNSGSNPASIILTTFEDAFDPSILAKGGTVVSGGSGGGGTSYDGVIRGFSVALPAGSNHIGTVDIGTMPTQTINMSSLPAGSNNIGSVNIASQPSLPAGSNHIGTVGIDGGVTITSMPAVQVSSQPVATAHQAYEATIGTTEVIWTLNQPISQINYLSNDDATNDLFVNFDNTVTTTPGNGQNGTMRIKAGEEIQNFPRQCSAIHLIRSVAGSTARMAGV